MSSIEQCPIFQELTLDEHEHVLGLLENKTYSKGKVILHEGESQQALWILTRGNCEVIKTTKTGEEQQLALLLPGAVFGEMSFLQTAPHSATVRALSDANVMQLTRERFDRLRESSPAAAQKVVRSVATVLASRLRRMDDWVCNFIERPGAARQHLEEWRDFRSKLYSDWQF